MVEVFQDRDVSASNRSAKRPGYDGLLEALRSGRVNAILARETSRLYRRPRQLEDLIDLIEGKGVEIATAYEGEVDLSTPNGRMMARIRVSVDKQESERLGERVRSAKREAQKDGRWLGGGRRPYGYDPVDEPGQPRLWVVNTDEAKVIRDIAQRIIRGDSLHRATVDLNERSIATVGGARWRPAHVKRLMLRDLPAGSFKRILKDDERRILNARLSAVKLKVGRPSSPRKYILTGIVVCSECGTKMTGSGGNAGNGHGGNYYVMYRCFSRDGGCGKVMIGSKRLESHLFDRLRDDIGKIITAHKVPEVVPDDEAVLAEMGDIEGRLDDLASNLDLSERVLVTRTNALETRMDELRAKLSVPRESARPETPEEVVTLTAKLYAKWRSGDLKEAEVLAMHGAIAEMVQAIRVKPKAIGGLEDRVAIEYR